MDDKIVDDVLTEYMAAQAKDPQQLSLLREWTARYPQFAPDLTAAAYESFVTQIPMGATPDTGEDESTIVLSRSVIAERRARIAQNQKATGASLISLLAEAEARGISPKDLADRLHVDRPLVSKLDQRLIRAATIPQALIQRIADTLERSYAEIADYLRGTPRLAMQAHFKAARKPALFNSAASASSQEDFLTALRASPKILEYDRQIWENEARTGKLLGMDENP